METKDEKKEIQFQKLTPNDNITLGIYEDALNYALGDEKIHNIAISGAYGAGKSSIMETYKKMHTDRKYLHISLAHFADCEGINSDEAGLINDLEGKIINQLLYQISPKRIPGTRFRVKENLDVDKAKKLTGIIIILFLLIVYLGCFDQFYNLVHGMRLSGIEYLLHFFATNEMKLVAILLLCLLTAYSCYQFVVLQMTRRFIKKINLKNNSLDVELFNEKDDSNFDRYLDEVLYLFEHSGAEVIIFEDLDRYKTGFVFEKLREINTLLNQRSEMFNLKNNICFIYMLRDDIFESKDRVKFFDFIIPVVPVVDGSNSYDLFLGLFQNSEVCGLIKEDFLQELSFYVDDMRMLKNIYNEFLVYHSKLQENETNHNWNKLLAMITYKNLFPKDFSDLQLGIGYVHGIFKKKDKIIEDRIKELTEDIQEKEASLSEADDELCKKIDELEAIYYINNVAPLSA